MATTACADQPATESLTAALDCPPLAGVGEGDEPEVERLPDELVEDAPDYSNSISFEQGGDRQGHSRRSGPTTTSRPQWRRWC